MLMKVDHTGKINKHIKLGYFTRKFNILKLLLLGFQFLWPDSLSFYGYPTKKNMMGIMS